MANYKTILSAYRNESQKYPGQFYLKVKNMTDKPFVVEPGDTFFLNETNPEKFIEHPTIPHFSKSIKLDD